MDVEPEGEDGGIWRRGQDHFRHFTSLLEDGIGGRDIDDSRALVIVVASSIQASGLALLGLKGRTNGTLFGEDILLFEHPERQHLGQHRFTHGDIVVISRSKPIGEKTIEGIVLERGPTRLRVVVSQRPKDLRKGTWRLDRGANRVAHDRMREALEMFHSVEGDRGTILRDVILGQVHDPEDNASMPPKISGKFNRSERIDVELNPSQNRSDGCSHEASRHHRPRPTRHRKDPHGCCNTRSICKRRTRADSCNSRIQRCSRQFARGLVELGVRAVRIGRPVKVRETLRMATLDAQIEDHPKQDELAIIRDEMDEVHRACPNSRDEKKDLRTEIFNTTRKRYDVLRKR